MVRLAAGNAVRAAHGHPDLRAAVRLAHGVPRIRFVLAASRTGRLFRLSTASRTVWTWRSVPVPGVALPPGWTCGNKTRSCAVQPMMTLEYAVAGESLPRRCARGPAGHPPSVGHLQLVSDAQVARAMAVSVNGGKTWHPAKITGHNGGYTATFRPGPV